jgi:methylated-DNA-protein-cysteine methyltransferase-like protein
MDNQFKIAIYQIVKLIPRGRVTTYGAIAKAIGYPNHSRQVGNAMGDCPKDVPAHRVVSSGGIIRVEKFQEKLETEGLAVVNCKIKNFKSHFWNPQFEIH